MYSLSGIREAAGKLKKKRCIISLFLILIGISIFLYPKISNDFAEKKQIEIIKTYYEILTDNDEAQMELEKKKAQKYNEWLWAKGNPIVDDYENLLNLNQDGMMSYIEIPKISAVLPIYHGTEEEILKKGVGHLENSSLPIGGKNTHCVLTGHTGLLRAEIFTKLTQLEIDDYFYLNTLGEKLIYQVDQIKVVLPTETENLKIKEGEDLVTLVTCTPYGVNTHRLLVQGERVERDENTQGGLKEKVSGKEEIMEKRKSYGWIWILCGRIVWQIIFKNIDF